MDRAGKGHDAEAAEPSAVTSYYYKPSLMGAPREFRLGTDSLHWNAGRSSGHVRYDQISRIRLSFRPTSMQTYRFLAEIWPANGHKLTLASASWRGLVQQERLDGPYRGFLTALHRRIAATGRPVALEAGSPPLVYWPGLVLFAAMAFGFAALIVRAVQQSSWPAVLLIGAFFILLLWQIGGIFRRNYPRRYTLDTLPNDLLP